MVAAMADPSDLLRRIGNALTWGVVELRSGDTCRVRIGDIVTGDIPFITGRAGATRTWSPPSPGEQVLVLAPEGDFEAAAALGGVFSTACPAPADDDASLIEFEDGAVIRYDPVVHALTAELPGDSSATIAADTIVLRGRVKVEGDVEVTGDVTAGAVSLREHRHDQVQAGTAVSGKPLA